MSWREVLGTANPVNNPSTQNTHNMHNGPEPGNSAYCAGSARNDSKLVEALTTACTELSICHLEVRNELVLEDIEEWHKGHISSDTLAAFASSLVQRREMDKGKVPAHFTEQAICKQCGPVWLWFSGKVQGCPWCWNRVNNKPIPRPCSINCANCHHFTRTDHPNLGHCSNGEPEATADLWDTDSRYCEQFYPNSHAGDT